MTGKARGKEEDGIRSKINNANIINIILNN